MGTLLQRGTTVQCQVEIVIVALTWDQTKLTQTGEPGQVPTRMKGHAGTMPMEKVSDFISVITNEFCFSCLHLYLVP